MKKIHAIKNVPVEVKKAIADYCEDEGITQAKYLTTDKRLKPYL